MRSRRRRPAIDGPGSRFWLRDLLDETVAGITQRPGRMALTMLGTVLGVGAFVAVLGLTTTAAGQIGRQFSALEDTTVTVNDVAAASGGSATPPGASPPMSFPADADQRVQRLRGVVAGGVWWPVPLQNPSITASPGGDSSAGSGLTVYAATPGAVAAMRLGITAGVTLDRYPERTRQPVVLLSQAAASQLGVSRLDAQPAIFINGIPFTVIGIYDRAQREPQTLLGLIIPASTALARYGNPDPQTQAAQMVIQTRLGAAQVVAGEVAAALRPDDPGALSVVAPPNPDSLRGAVSSDLSGLFLALAGISLVIGAVGIANTTLVAVMERVEEIGLRRSLGALPRHIAVQFLCESAAVGTIGGLAGTTLGVVTVITVAVARHWTAVIDPAVTLPAPLTGTMVGLAAGLYPALRAARTRPIDALRHG